MPPRKIYSDEFKRDAIRLLETSGKKLSEIEQELGLPHGLIRRWQQRFQISTADNSLELNEVERLKAELRKLKRENEVLRQERDILKKTVGIFSQSERGEIPGGGEISGRIPNRSDVQSAGGICQWILRLAKARTG